MAADADTTEQLDDSTPTDENSDVDAREADDDGIQSAQTPTPPPLSSTRFAIAAGLVVVAAVGGLAGWLGYRSYQAHEAAVQRNLYLQVARQAAVNLTTISYTEVDADVQRILDSATGSFYDDFQGRSQPFIDVVKQAQSKSEGTVTEAGLESETADQAQVLVAVSVKTSIAAAPEQDPRHWRMRISVQKVGDGAKVSNVGFVP
jgi:Mce-associated membrane protein